MQKYFTYQNNQLCAEKVCLAQIAQEFGTPCYVYSRTALEQNWQRFDNALQAVPHLICYAVKANSNIGILNLLAKLGSGFDIVSGGELQRVLAAKGDPQKIMYSGVGKTDDEIELALNATIYCFNVESELELERINVVAKRLDKIAPISFRVNPNVDAKTHPYIATGLRENKFGIEFEKIIPLCHILKTYPNVKLIGIGCHIGSQLTNLSPLTEAIDRVVDLVQTLTTANFSLEFINIGGGLGVIYQDETPPSIEEYVTTVLQHLSKLTQRIVLEPGRAIIADAGVLLTKVEYLKPTVHKNFAIVDAAMTELIRPALYSAWQNILPVNQSSTAKIMNYDIVGPVCESTDFLGKNRKLSLAVNDLLAIAMSGAYGFSMSSNYNTRPRAAEILVDKEKVHLIRERETVAELFAREKLI